MAAKSIREFDAKNIAAAYLAKQTCENFKWKCPKMAQVKVDIDNVVQDDWNDCIISSLQKTFDSIEEKQPWIISSQLVVKPDQLIKRRGKAGLVLLDKSWVEVKAWITENIGKEIRIGAVTGFLKCFLIEEYIPHQSKDELYLCILSQKEGDIIMICKDGGVDVGDVDVKAKRVHVPVGSVLEASQITDCVKLAQIDDKQQPSVVSFISVLYSLFVKAHFTYLEINPLVCLENNYIYLLDLAVRVDQTADFECGNRIWGEFLEFPTPFGRESTKEEAYVANLDARTGASLKLTILNSSGRVWTMVAGGGASVAYTDAIVSCGYSKELANYGEYSGAPSEAQTYEYSKTILDLMTRGLPYSNGKILFIGGGIANFTNVASTFKGIAKALTEYRLTLIEHKISIFVRRGGPNYQEGLRRMRELGDSLNVPIYVFGPETHITSVVPLALEADRQGIPFGDAVAAFYSTQSNTNEAASLLNQVFKPTQVGIRSSTPLSFASTSSVSPIHRNQHALNMDNKQIDVKAQLFTSISRSFVYGMQPKAVQGMLDFDFICQRSKPSVAAMIYPFGGDHVQKFYWGTKETMIPVYRSFSNALDHHPEATIVINFASHRSVLESCTEIMEPHPKGKISTIAIIAEGVPERHSRQLAHLARHRNVTLIGPATVGGLRAGSFKIGNTGGMIDNIVSSKLYRPGSVSYVSKSGGMSNELNNIIARYTDGVLEGIAIGGDKYPGSTFMDHITRFETDPACKMIVLLGEVGGIEEYDVIKAIKNGSIKKPIIAWCLGTCADVFNTEVQFGHAGALAGNPFETAIAKNDALKEAGVIVPECFEKLPNLIATVYDGLVRIGDIVPALEPEMPQIPIDYSWAQELGLIRKPAQFVSTICDDRGQELLYAGMPISSVFKENIGIGGVVSLLWFRRRLPEWACQFIEMVLMLTADHGPAVSGAHNTIVTARAGKDLISSLASGLLTIVRKLIISILFL